MKNFYFLLFCIASLTQCKQNNSGTSTNQASNTKPTKTANLPRYWDDPKISYYHREDSRTDFLPYETEELATKAIPQSSSRFISLNGFWKHRFFPSPEYLPEGIESVSNSSLQWTETSIPSCMELKGFGAPFFAYHHLPFPSAFPRAPIDQNSVQVFKRKFEVKEAWSSQDVYAVFEGVSSAYFIYVNGFLAGYSEDSKCISEFHISPYLKKENEITLIVFRYSDGSYLSTHDQWHWSGIYRKAYLLARPKVKIKDFFAKTSLDNSYKNGELDLTVDLQNNEDLDVIVELSVAITLHNEKEKLWSGTKSTQVLSKQTQSINLQNTISKVRCYSDETPDLYDLFITLKQNGKEIDALKYSIGFRKMEIKNNVAMWNGKEMLIHGAAFNEHDVQNGMTLDPSNLENHADILQLNNINAVRTAQGPSDPVWYSKAKEAGIYILDQANIDLNGIDSLRQLVANGVNYKDAYLFRVKNMFEQNKNHCNIFAWSLGYECSSGENTILSQQYIKSKDQQRWVSSYNQNFTFGDIALSEPAQALLSQDKVQLMYTMIKAHGNSMCGLNDIWSEVKKKKMLGGFIESWNEQCFASLNSHSLKVYNYGSRAKDLLSPDSLFAVKGLVSSDLAPMSPFYSLKNVFRPFEVRQISVNSYSIQSNLNYKSTEAYSLFYSIFEDGVKLSEKQFNPLPIKPRSEVKANIDLSGVQPKPGAIYSIQWNCQMMAQHKGMQRMLNVGVDAYELKFNNPPTINAEKTGDLKVISDGEQKIIGNDFFTVTISSKTGCIHQIQLEKSDLLVSELKPNFWRPNSTEEKCLGSNQNEKEWNENLKTIQINECKLNPASPDGSFVVICKGTWPSSAGSMMSLQYTIRPTAEIEIAADFSFPGATTAARRAGFNVGVIRNLSTCEWYGCGLQESYSDRCDGLVINNYRTEAKKMFLPMTDPQDGANRSHCRWMNISTFEDLNLMVRSKKEFDFAYLPIDPVELDGKTKQSGFEIPFAKNNSLLISDFVHGSGSKKIQQVQKQFRMQFSIALYNGKKIKAIERARMK